MDKFNELADEFADWLIPDEYDIEEAPIFTPSSSYSNEELSLDDDPADMMKIDPRIREYNSAFYPKQGKRFF